MEIGQKQRMQPDVIRKDALYPTLCLNIPRPKDKRKPRAVFSPELQKIYDAYWLLWK